MWTRFSAQFLGSRLKWDVAENPLVGYGRCRIGQWGLCLRRGITLGEAAPLEEGTSRRESLSCEPSSAHTPGGWGSERLSPERESGGHASVHCGPASQQDHQISPKESDSSQGILPPLQRPGQERIQRRRPHQTQEALLCLEDLALGWPGLSLRSP